jgi:hypothetical protein
MEESYIQKRNFILSISFATFWLLWSIGFPVTSSKPVMSSNLYLGWIPTIAGLAFALLLSGDWFQRVVWSAAMPLVPMVITFIFFGRGTDAEGTAWLLMFSIGPFLFYAFGAALGVLLANTYVRRFRNEHNP